MAAKPHPKVLLVEGDEDKRVIPYLIEAHGIPWGERDEPKVVHIEAYGGIEAMLEPGEIETQLKASELQALGILVDANGDGRELWFEIARRAETGEWIERQADADVGPTNVSEFDGLVYGWGTGVPGERRIVEHSGTSFVVEVSAAGWWVLASERTSTHQTA